MPYFVIFVSESKMNGLNDRRSCAGVSSSDLNSPND